MMIHDATTAAGYLLVLSIMVPTAGVLAAFVAGGRHIERVVIAAAGLGLLVAGAVAIELANTGRPLVYLLGGWAPPLGVALRADGLSVVMMATAAVVICAISVFAYAGALKPDRSGESRAPFAFWILLLAVWAALNAVFTGGDFFTLYVALELLTFAAVPLVSLDGSGATLRAALRYLLFALAGSVLYLTGVALLYGVYGTLDIALLSERIQSDPTTIVAAVLMTVGLMAKTALFPFHQWLPPAHAGAPPAASAVLSALVVKGSFFIIVRLWFDVMPALHGTFGSQAIGVLGASAIVFGSVVALRQARLKLLIAYSTVAQIGYLFLMFPLALDPVSATLHDGAGLTGGMMKAISHATAKAAMFMTAGVIYAALGHDRIAGLAGAGRASPLSVFSFALAGVALIGVPPGGSLLQTAIGTGQWWWAATVVTGSMLTGAYVILVVWRAVAPVAQPPTQVNSVSRTQELAALALALIALWLGLTTLPVTDVIAMGRP